MDTYSYRRSHNLCVWCGNPTDGHVYCEEHRQRHAEHVAKKRQKDKDLLRCTECGEPTERGITLCNTCAKKRNGKCTSCGLPCQSQQCHKCQRIARYKHKYGITIEDYNAMLVAQEGKCAICGRTDPGRRGSVNFHIDHNHKTNQIRGLLCNQCNLLVGHIESSPDSVEKAIVYLQERGSGE